MNPSATVTIPADGKQTATIIFLHGLGDTGHGWASRLQVMKPKYAKLICPTAAVAPVTINKGKPMPAWFDISEDMDEEGIKKAAAEISRLIQDEVLAGIPASRIILGGFSQGAALSMYIGLTGGHLLAGIVCLSGFFPIMKSIQYDRVKRPPILQCHGDSDPVLPYEVGLSTSKILQEKLKFTDYTFKTYPYMAHSTCEEEIFEVVNFFKKNLPEK